MMGDKVVLALPSKGRLMEKTESLFLRAGFPLARGDTVRQYRAHIPSLPGFEVVFLSAQEIVYALRDGAVDLGVSGEDLFYESFQEAGNEGGSEVILKLGFGKTDVVVAVPQCWLDVATMADLEDVAVAFHARHRLRLRVATKYMALTRRWFGKMGVSSYRIVESLGATEGTPASGSAEVIVDITTTGATLRANGLKILDDGVLLSSEAALLARSSVRKRTDVVELINRLEKVVSEEAAA